MKANTPLLPTAGGVSRNNIRPQCLARASWRGAKLIISLPASGKTAGKDTYMALGTLKKKGGEGRGGMRGGEGRGEGGGEGNKIRQCSFTNVAEVHFSSILLPRV